MQQNAFEGKAPVVGKGDAENHEGEEKEIALRLGRRQDGGKFPSMAAENQGRHCKHGQHERGSHRLQEGQDVLGPRQQHETAEKE